MDPGEAPVQLLAQDGRGGAGLFHALGRHLAMKAGRQQPAGLAVFQPVQYLAQDAKARGHDAAGIARMHALGEDLHLEHAAGHAAQAGGEPELVVVAGAGIEADHQADVAQALAQRVHVGQQVVGAAFLAGLDQADDARVRELLALERGNGGDAGVHGVAVVGAAAAIQPAVLVLRRPRAEVLAPAAEFGLLVQVAVHQDGLGRHVARALATAGRHFAAQHRRAALEPDHFESQALHLLRLDPGRGVAHNGVDVAVLRPLRVEHRRLRGHGDVILQLGHDLAVPGLADLGQRALGLESAGRKAGVHGQAPGGAAVAAPLY